MIKSIPMEDWLRGCVHHDGRHGYVTLPCDEVLKIADFIERLRADRKTEPTISKMEQVDEPKTQTETQNSNKNSNVISVYDGISEAVRCAMCSNPNKSDRGCDGACSYDEKLYERIMKAIAESIADTPQTERKCIDCNFLTYMFGKTWCNIKCENPHDKVCDRFKPKTEPQTEREGE